MPSWGEILNEINDLMHGMPDNQKGLAFHQVRTKYMKALADSEGRDCIIYATRWTSQDAPPFSVSINDEDIHAFMEALYGLKNNKLDLILHTGGGSAESAEAIISYLRRKYSHIRIIIPQAAMSAGTMMACAGDIIVMGKQSSIGPIDPQFLLQTPSGTQAVAAHAIIEQFEMAQKDCAENPKNLNSWIPMLSQYGPALLVSCKNQIDFGRDLVKNWLSSYMFAGQTSTKPDDIASYLSNHGNFRTHAKHISCSTALELGLKVFELERNQHLQDKILSVFHSTMHIFGSTGTTKIIANHNGNCYMKQMNIQPIRR